MIAIPGLHITENDDGLAAFAITAKGHSIIDPRMDEGCTGAVPPKYYGLTKTQADFLVKLNETLDTATTSALNAGCYDIQNAFGIDHGDLAGVYFSDKRRLQAMRQMFAEYMVREMQAAMN